MQGLFNFVMMALMLLGFVIIGRAAIYGPPDQTEDNAPDETDVIAQPVAPPSVGPALGALRDKTGTTARYRSRVLTTDASPYPAAFSSETVTLVCGADKDEALMMFVANGQPHAANGMTQMFAKRWGVTLEVDGVAKPVIEYTGAVGGILTEIQSLCD